MLHTWLSPTAPPRERGVPASAVPAGHGHAPVYRVTRVNTGSMIEGIGNVSRRTRCYRQEPPGFRSNVVWKAGARCGNWQPHLSLTRALPILDTLLRNDSPVPLRISLVRPARP